MITAGQDFTHMFAEANFDFLEKVMTLLSKTKEAAKFRFKFSTVDEYF